MHHHNATNQDVTSKVVTRLPSDSSNYDDIENLQDSSLYSVSSAVTMSSLVSEDSSTMVSVPPPLPIIASNNANSFPNTTKSNVTKQSSSQQSVKLNRRRQQQQQHQNQQQQQHSQCLNGKGRKDSRWVKFHRNVIFGGEIPTVVTLGIAVLLWYLLGVVSIGTTKLLLNHGVPPFYLTLQQLFLGSNLLRCLLKNHKTFGSSGLNPWPTVVDTSLRTSSRRIYSFPGSLLLYV
jgi:hypothetical protein